MRRSNPLKFISLLHVSILKDHHQGVNVPIYEVIEVPVSLLLVKTKGQDCDCLCELVVGMYLSMSKMSVSQSSETSEHVSTYNSHKSIVFHDAPNQSHDFY